MMKKCPNCGKEIFEDAIICRHCKQDTRDLDVKKEDSISSGREKVNEEHDKHLNNVRKNADKIKTKRADLKQNSFYEAMAYPHPKMKEPLPIPKPIICSNCGEKISGSPRYCPNCRAINDYAMVNHLATVKSRMDRGTATKEDREYFNNIVKDINEPYQIHPKKKAWIAILLNLFPIIMGTGYIYLGRWKRFWITIAIQIIVPSIFNTMGLYDISNLVLLLTWLFTIFEAYALTRKYPSDMKPY